MFLGIVLFYQLIAIRMLYNTGTEHLSLPTAPTLVCSMFGFSRAALVTQAGDLVSWLWDFLQHQYNKQHITISNTKPDPEPPPT